MKNYLTPYHVLAVLAGALLTIASSSGVASSRGSGYSGASRPNGSNEMACGICHRGNDAYGEAVVTTEILDGNGVAVTDYTPGDTYTVNITIASEMGDPAGYGFQMAVVDDATSNTVGNYQNPGPGTGITILNPDTERREYAEQTRVSDSGVFTVEWVAPASGTGEVTFYTVGNAVNGDGGNGIGDAGSREATTVALREARALPVELTSFTGRAVKNSVDISWTTAAEQDFSHFNVERAESDGDFVQIATVPGGGSSYQLTDREAAPGANIYRLNMIDLDGSSAYSDILTVSVDVEQALVPYPNPAQNHVNVSNVGENGTLNVRDLQGRLLSSTKNAPFVDVSELTPGVYLIESITGEERRTARFVKQ